LGWVLQDAQTWGVREVRRSGRFVGELSSRQVDDDAAAAQGSPLSPLLSNVMLDDLDWELDRRGHCFVRYADDGRIYVRSRRAGERVMQSITQYVEQHLKLKVNREKSVVDRAIRRPLLGFGFFVRGGQVKVRIDPKARKRAKDRLRQLTSRRWGGSMERRIKEINESPDVPVGR